MSALAESGGSVPSGRLPSELHQVCRFDARSERSTFDDWTRCSMTGIVPSGRMLTGSVLSSMYYAAAASPTLAGEGQEAQVRFTACLA